MGPGFFTALFLFLGAGILWLACLRRLPDGRALPMTDDIPIGNGGKRIGILIVAYNALTTLSATLKRIPADVWEQIEEVAIFDDASSDETYELAHGVKLLFGLEKLTILKNQHNLGYGGNQKRGYEYFLAKGFDIVVMLHGDGQYAPEILAQIYAPLVSGEADAVFGSRMMNRYGGPLKGGMPIYKYVGNKALTAFANKFLGMRLTEFHSGYRAYRLDALRAVDLSHMTDDFHFDTEIIIKWMHQGFRIKEVPIPTYYGKELCYVNGINYARKVVRAVGRYRLTLTGRTIYPEFQEYAVHYPLKESRYSSHYYFQRIASHGQEILDIGCGEGHFSALVARNGNIVVGIDRLPVARRSTEFDRYISADLNQGLAPALPALAGRRFDLVLLQDVLEHLQKPDRVLRDCRKVLKPKGMIAISLPNVANITVRLALMMGRFEYAPRGILDRTHLRFFTRKSARRFIKENGFEVVRQWETVMPVELALGLSAQSTLARLVNRMLHPLTAIFPGLLGYQTILIGRQRTAAEGESAMQQPRRAA